MAPAASSAAFSSWASSSFKSSFTTCRTEAIVPRHDAGGVGDKHSYSTLLYPVGDSVRMSRDMIF